MDHHDPQNPRRTVERVWFLMWPFCVTPIVLQLQTMSVRKLAKLGCLALYCGVESHAFLAVRNAGSAPLPLARTTLSPRCRPHHSFRRRTTEHDSESDGVETLLLNATLGDELAPVTMERFFQLPLSFSHLHLFVDHLESLDVYQRLEAKLNHFHDVSSGRKLEDKRKLWALLSGSETKPFVPQKQDVVKQLMTGFGFRVTGYRFPSKKNHANTESVLVTSKDPNGVQILVTAAVDGDGAADNETDEFVHFDLEYYREFFHNHADRQGIAVLGFRTEDIESVHNRYKQIHPDLIHSYREYSVEGGFTTKVLQVFAYYNETNEGKRPDRGTMLRFVGTDGTVSETSMSPCPLPGLEFAESSFDSFSEPAYCDHWVSNVHSRTDFWKTLEDVLGFSPKVSHVLARRGGLVLSLYCHHEYTQRSSRRRRILMRA
jgi:hypothetical protein